jgi:predicted secreted Zn-dependent protease
MIMEWRKSSYSGTNGQCIEAAPGPGLVLVRDSKDRSGPVLTFTPAQWTAFAAGVRDGEFDLT